MSAATKGASGMAHRPALQVQIVVYENAETEVARAVEAVAAAVAEAQSAGSLGRVTLSIGDSSPTQSLTQSCLDSAQREIERAPDSQFRYCHFGENLGSGGGSNALAASSTTDLLWILNPDTYPAPTALVHLIDALGAVDVAAADARQLPVEHPKGFDHLTGDAAWVSGACMLIKAEPFRMVGGFDAQFFPMYCDDVDLSWRLRLAGWRVVHQPFAVVYHNKRLDQAGLPAASDFEHESGMLSRLFLARRYNRQDVVDSTLSWVDSSGEPAHRRAAIEYRRRLAIGELPEVLHDAAAVADLNSDYYGPSRFHY